MRDGYELDRAINILKQNYERALRLEYVRNPIAWALYYTWKEFHLKGAENEQTISGI